MSSKEEYWKKHIKQWKKSGLSRNAYCIANGIYQSTLTSWIKKLEQPMTPVKLEIPISAVENTDDILVEAPGLRINIPQSIKPELLTYIIRELKVCS